MQETTASVALEMPVTALGAAKTVATDVMVPEGVRAMIVPFLVLNARKKSPNGRKKTRLDHSSGC